ncbi:MAG: amidase family protein, partial [Rhodomicrobium sp.]
FTVTVNMAALPGLSVPAGFSSEGLPLGLQIIGKPFDEALVLRAGQVIEDAVGRMPIPAPWWANGGEETHAGKTPIPKKPAPKKKAVSPEGEASAKTEAAKMKPRNKQNGSA